MPRGGAVVRVVHVVRLWQKLSQWFVHLPQKSMMQYAVRKHHESASKVVKSIVVWLSCSLPKIDTFLSRDRPQAVAWSFGAGSKNSPYLFGENVPRQKRRPKSSQMVAHSLVHISTSGVIVRNNLSAAKAVCTLFVCRITLRSFGSTT